METARKKEPLIFIVEDDAEMGGALQGLLAYAGFTTRLFQDPLVATRAFTDSHLKPDLLITDFKMPSMDGMELIRKCKALRPELKSISISGSLAEDLRKHYIVHPDKFLPKPFTIETLIATIDELLGKDFPRHRLP